MRIRLYASALLIVAASSIVAACGSDSGSAGNGAATTVDPNSPTLDVTAKSFSFTPNRLTVKAGESATVVLHVKDVSHDFTINELGVHIAGKAGETVRQSVTFDKPGTYTFFCSIAGHREAGMTGTLTVQ